MENVFMKVLEKSLKFLFKKGTNPDSLQYVIIRLNSCDTM